VVVGQGYVGLPLAMAAVEAGYRVVGLDVDEPRSSCWPPGSPTWRTSTTTGSGPRWTPAATRPDHRRAAAAGFDVAVISVPTPLHEGAPDLTYIEDSARALAPLLTEGATVILESTTYPGTTEELVGPILEEGSGLAAGAQFHLGYSPERIDPGNATWTLREHAQGGLGHRRGVAGQGAGLLRPAGGAHGGGVQPREAELTKLLENTFRHVNIALVNELAMFADDLGIDVWEAIDAASTKPFGYMRFTPGPGVGGHCLPIDPSYLSWQVRRSLGQSFRFVELANDVNEHMPDYVVRRLIAALNRQGLALKGRRILLLGLSYKRNTGDARESPSHHVARQLQRYGAEVRAADPHVLEVHGPEGVALVDCTPRSWPRPTPWCCWSTTTPSTSTRWWPTAPTSSTPAGCCPAPRTSSASDLRTAPLKVVVTGGAGFIGANLCRRLAAEPASPRWSLSTTSPAAPAPTSTASTPACTSARSSTTATSTPASRGRPRWCTWRPGRRCPAPSRIRWPATP
jgi:UDP-N-acetyl-D-glucosamine dehydrogenase